MNDMLIDDQSNAAPVPPPAVEFGVAAADYATHRQGQPAETYRRLAALGVGRPGQDVVDLGTGTGDLARGLARAGARVVGVDPSTLLLAEAARLAGAAGLHVRWQHGTAEATGLPGGSADVVTAAQAWHWFDAGRATVEARRLLRPGGALAIVYFDWLEGLASIVDTTLALVARHREAPMPAATRVGHRGIYPTFPEQLHAAGFRDLELFGFDTAARYSHAGWLGRMRASAGVSTMTPAGQAGFAADLGAALAALPDPVSVPHRVFGLVGRVPGA
ncbi:MAG: class I SAM-dependent methyltransferase [Myxococcales bacterium]|nr:class I SAM-dependent methyltransferase [Myxococcales bacterium]